MTQQTLQMKEIMHILGAAMLLTTLTGLVSANNLKSQTNTVTQIEGLYYLDHSPIRVEIENGIITNFTRIEELSSGNEHLYIGPGLIDTQVNGFVGVSFVDTGGELTFEGIDNITQTFWNLGTTSYFPTITTNDQDIFTKNFAMLAKAKVDPGSRGSIAGFHLEGPYISPHDGFRGAHPLKFVRKPDWDEFMEMYNASRQDIKVVTVAPEVEGAMEFISKARDLGIVVALGHHNGNTQQVTEAIDRGAQIATHLGNGLANTINRFANPLWPQLSDDRFMASIIADGHHLRPEQIRVFHKAKDTDRIVMVSDVSPLGGLEPGYYFNAIGDTLEVTHDGAVVYPGQGTFAGSASPLINGIGHIMKVTGCSLGDALHMATRNPARLYGLDDRGEIKAGKRADFILFNLNDFELDIQQTIVSGEIVYEKK